ncbi:MAG: nitronate monooxygenase [Dehalococcoidia bacterium]|nr:nitronate monooxygenase [Dehalococcoidia bacterium]
MLKTALCDLAGIKYPIIQAGMGPFKMERLNAACANAGILAAIPMSGVLSDVINSIFGDPASPEVTKKMADGAKACIYRVAHECRGSEGKLAINCMISEEMVVQGSGEMIKAAIEAREEDREIKEKLTVIITSAGNPKRMTDIIKPSGIKWFHVVPSAFHALKAEQAGCDAVIASGHEGGGHTAWEPVHSMVLLPAVARAVKIPVIGAGGYVDGASLVAALALGGCGIQMGTRFIATQESDFADIWKNRIVKSEVRDSVVARGFVGPLRYIKNKASVELAELTLKNIPTLYIGHPDSRIDPEIQKLEEKGSSYQKGTDDDLALIYGGESAGRINDIPRVKDLVERIATEAEEIISKFPSYIKH